MEVNLGLYKKQKKQVGIIRHIIMHQVPNEDGDIILWHYDMPCNPLMLFIQIACLLVAIANTKCTHKST